VALPEELMEILACPNCHSAVVEQNDELRCTGCGLRYPIRDGIPVMLVEEAHRPDEEEA
jgi:uncharacterized protein YbaR (Trm112 family)